MIPVHAGAPPREERQGQQEEARHAGMGTRRHLALQSYWHVFWRGVEISARLFFSFSCHENNTD